jgi:hypothetical protein
MMRGVLARRLARISVAAARTPGELVAERTSAATSGPATSGPATSGPATNSSATIGPATSGPAAPIDLTS